MTTPFLPDPDALRRLTTCLRVAHHLPGRLRLKLDTPLNDAPPAMIADARQLKQAIENTPGVRTVSLNVLARSCTVEYDPAHIPPAAWEHLVAGVASREAGLLLNLLSSGRTPPGLS